MSQHRSDVFVPCGIIDYPARDMTITVGAAMPFRELNEILHEECQQLPIDVPDPEIAVGDMVAMDIAGPRQYCYGTLRDYVIGLEAVDGKGRRFHAGGRVVKNVAGYDLCRLLVGSQNTMGTLTQLTFKVRPLPASRSLLVAGFRTLQNLESALSILNTTATTPVILDVLNRPAAQSLLNTPTPELAHDSVRMDALTFLVVAFEGPEVACNWQNSTLSREIADSVSWIHIASLPDASQLWCQAAQQATVPNDSISWLASLTTLPSQVSAVMGVLHELGCDVYGRAGNGVLYCRPSSRNQVPVPPDESAGIGMLHALTANSNGSVNVIKSNSMRSSVPPESVGILTSRLQSLLGT
jgi:glycolate oxidase FAD binding subunit